MGVTVLESWRRKDRFISRVRWTSLLTVRVSRSYHSPLKKKKAIKTVNLFCKLRVVKLFHWTVYLNSFTGGKKRHKFEKQV